MSKSKFAIKTTVKITKLDNYYMVKRTLENHLILEISIFWPKFTTSTVIPATNFRQGDKI